jgi:GAF domain-containing protein
MTIMGTTTIALIIAGTIIMIISAVNSRRAFEVVQAGRYRTGWNILRYLIAIFVAAYASTLLIFFIGHQDILELVLGLILLSGSLAIYTVVRLVYRSARESQTISEIGRVINSSPSIQSVWDEVTELIRAEVPYDRISIGVFDEIRDQWVHAYIKGIEIPDWGIGDAVASSASINTLTVGDTRGQVMRTNPSDLSAAELVGQKPAIDAGLVSGITVPLIANNTVVAGMNLRSAKANAYSKKDISVVNRIADQIAGAVQNSRLLQDVERNAEQAEALAEIGRIINSSLAIDEVYERFASAVATIIPFDRLAVSRIDGVAGTNTTNYISGTIIPDRGPGGATPIDGTFAQVIAGKGSVALLVGEPDSPEVQKYPGAVSTFQAGIRASIATPLVSRDETTGILYIQSTKIDAYDNSHLSLAVRIASQMSEAIANAELHATIEQEAKERQAIGEIGRIISSSLDIEEVYEAFATNLENLIPFDTINISAIDEDTDSYTILYGYGATVPGRDPGAQIPSEGTLARETAIKRHGIIAQANPESIRKHYPVLSPPLDAGLRSFLAVPLIHNDKPIGVLQIRSKTPNAYSDAHLDLARRISDQIAGAIDNARLHSNLENAAEEREVLAKLGE